MLGGVPLGGDGVPNNGEIALSASVVTVGLSKAYGSAQALTRVNLEVPTGALYGLIGPNGAGKTTLLEILAGLRLPTSGEVHLAAQRAAIGYCPDVAEFEPWLTATEVIDLSLSLLGQESTREAVATVLDLVGLGKSAHRRVGGFSRGMTTRLNLGAALVAQPQILLLDEPVASLDPLGRADILDLLASLAGQTTVIVSSHDLSGVEELCTDIGVLVGGRLLFQGRTADLLASVRGDRWLVEVRPPATTVLAILSAAPWVSQVKETAPGRIELHAPAADQVESHLSRLLADAGARVVALSPVRPSLDEAFLALTAAPRDEGRS